VTVAGYADRLEVSVTDDDIELGPERQRDGLGLRGIEERVKELNGAVKIASSAGGGTTLAIRLPLARQPSEARLAGTAG
jgi:signal transduction histidine kinase